MVLPFKWNLFRQQCFHMVLFFLSPWANSNGVTIPWNETLLAALLHKTIHLWGFFLKKTEFLCESFLWQLLGLKGLTRLLTLRLQGTEWTLDQLKNLTRNFFHTKFFKINVLFTRKWWTTSNFNLSQWVFTIYPWREHWRLPDELLRN